MYKLKKIFKNEKGQGMVEYGLILATVSIVAILGLSALGGNIKDQLEGITDAMGVTAPGKYSDEEIDDLIKNHNFIPVVTADELNNVRSGAELTYGKGTKWEYTYTGGLDKKYIQVANIDLSGYDKFEPIGRYSGSGEFDPDEFEPNTDNTNKAFKGFYDGGGYKIKNLTVKGVSDFAGLFGFAEGATLIHIGLVNVDVNGGKYVGGLVGMQFGSTVSDSYVKGSVNGLWESVGGLVGWQKDSSVSDSYTTGQVSGGNNVGGLVGIQFGSTVSESYTTGTVNGTSVWGSVGGLIGWQDNSTISDSYAKGKVTGAGNNVGGLVGIQFGSEVLNSYAKGAVNGTEDNVGGLIGFQETSTVSKSYATGSVNGENNVGGLVGIQFSSTVSESYAKGEVTGTGDNVGDLVGLQDN